MHDLSIEHYSPLDEGNVDINNLTLSLISEGCRTKLLSAHDAETIQIQILKLLQKNILKYTHHESSSVPEETAQNIMKSILYTLDHYLAGSPSLYDSINLLKATPIKDIYQKGLTTIRSFEEEAVVLFSRVRQTELEIPMVAYQASIGEGITDFFKYYDLEFAAHDTPGSIDYPLLSDNTKDIGIIYIKKYLTKLLMENQFCRHFPHHEIILLLNNYEKQYGFSYQEMLINISGLIFNNSLFSVLLGKNPLILSLTLAECRQIEETLGELSAEECYLKVSQGFELMIDWLGISDDNIIYYLRDYLDRTYPSLYRAIQEKSIPNTLVINPEHDLQETIYYLDGEKMSDENLRSLISELQLSRSGTAKAAMIISEVHSMEDLIEILGADCVFEKEYNYVFDSLRDEHIALIISIFFNELSLKAAKNKELSIDNLHRSENEAIWLQKLLDYLDQIQIERKNNLITLANKILPV